MLNNFPPEFTLILTRFYQLSYDSGIFPNVWKTEYSQYLKKAQLLFQQTVVQAQPFPYSVRWWRKSSIAQFHFSLKNTHVIMINNMDFITLHYSYLAQISWISRMSKASGKVWYSEFMNKLLSYGLSMSYLFSFMHIGHCSTYNFDWHIINAGGSVFASTLFHLYTREIH